jgi:thiol-disulfide isomerase/thioredoxin
MILTKREQDRLINIPVFFHSFFLYLCSSLFVFLRKRSTMKQTLFLSLFVLWFSCSDEQDKHRVLSDETAKVLVMLAPDCPLCKNYTKDLKELVTEYREEIVFYGVVPGAFYTHYEVDSFLEAYGLPLNIIFDPELKLTKQLNASITPEVFFIDEFNNIRYQGLFDNWLGELGRRRQVVNVFYLKDALDAYLKNTPIEIIKTKAIGCFIE